MNQITSIEFDEVRFKRTVHKALGGLSGVDLEELEGVSQEQLEDFERELPRCLPRAVRTFLRTWGKHRGEVFEQYGVTYPIMVRNLTIRDEINRVLAFAGQQLAEHHLVLDYHLAAELHFLDLNGGDDPPVFAWDEGAGGIEDAEVRYASFSEFVLYLISTKARYLEAMK